LIVFCLFMYMYLYYITMHIQSTFKKCIRTLVLLVLSDLYHQLISSDMSASLTYIYTLDYALSLSILISTVTFITTSWLEDTALSSILMTQSVFCFLIRKNTNCYVYVHADGTQSCTLRGLVEIILSVNVRLG